MEGKVIIVTGGNGLLGTEICNHLTTKGAIVINADIDAVDSDFDIKCDITDDESIEKTVKIVLNKFGRIDGLVNNAYPRSKEWGVHFEDVKPENLRMNVDYQLNSYFIFCQNVLPVMRKQNSGSIVNMASIYGVVGNDFTIYNNTNIYPPSEYAAIKGGIINLTRYLASLYGKNNVRVNSLSPGGIFDQQPETFVKAYEAKVPLRRMGKPEDIAPAVSFLLSDASKYITGHNLMVDGGWTAI